MCFWSGKLPGSPVNRAVAEVVLCCSVSRASCHSTSRGLAEVCSQHCAAKISFLTPLLVIYPYNYRCSLLPVFLRCPGPSIVPEGQELTTTSLCACTHNSNTLLAEKLQEVGTANTENLPGSLSSSQPFACWSSLCPMCRWGGLETVRSRGLRKESTFLLLYSGCKLKQSQELLSQSDV